MSKRIKIFDTTLRDGEQSPGCSMNLSEKLLLAEQLDKLGVDVIEAGFAIASPGDFASVKNIAKVVKNASVASLARALKKDIDTAYDAVKDAVHPRIHLFIATSELHMKYKLKMTKEEVLRDTFDMVSYAKSLCDDIEFSAEDASRSEIDFLVEVFETAIKAGATTINVPDTVGYSTPKEYGDLIFAIKSRVKGVDNVDISVHCHNDLGLATANSLSAIENGATQVECTVNGIGERAGNAALEEIVMALKTRAPIYDCETHIETTQIYKTSKLLSRITGVKIQPNKAIVGDNAFAHESGIHQHGVMAHKETYEIMTPESIGLSENKMVLGKHSGKHALEDRLTQLGFTLNADEMKDAFVQFKKLADRQKSVSDKDLEALMHKSAVTIPEVFILDRFVINVGNTITATSSVAMTNSDGETKEVVKASKFGPIDASYKAINEIVGFDNFELVDFLIDSVTGGTDAQGAVTVKLKQDDKIYNGHAVSLDIVDAAVKAYVSAINNMVYDVQMAREMK